MHIRLHIGIHKKINLRYIAICYNLTSNLILSTYAFILKSNFYSLIQRNTKYNNTKHLQILLEKTKNMEEHKWSMWQYLHKSNQMILLSNMKQVLYQYYLYNQQNLLTILLGYLTQTTQYHKKYLILNSLISSITNLSKKLQMMKNCKAVCHCQHN